MVITDSQAFEKVAKITPKEIEKSTKTNNLRDAFFNLIGGVENEME